MATIISHSPADTFSQGKALGIQLRGGEVIALCGDLGAGKTHFVKGVAAGLGHDPDEVTSPTFTLVHEYNLGRLPLFHFDFYRLETEDEALQLGFDDYMDSGGVLAIEWADKFEHLLPPGTKWFNFRVGSGDERNIDAR